MEVELEVFESEDYSEFPACESVEVKLCQRCKRKATAKRINQHKLFLEKCGESKEKFKLGIQKNSHNAFRRST